MLSVIGLFILFYYFICYSLIASLCLYSIGSIFCLIWHIYAIRPMSTGSEGYTTRLQLPHWAELSDIYVNFYTTESLGGDDLYDFPAIL